MENGGNDGEDEREDAEHEMRMDDIVSEVKNSRKMLRAAFTTVRPRTCITRICVRAPNELMMSRRI
jgi:hypothetical protein